MKGDYQKSNGMQSAIDCYLVTTGGSISGIVSIFCASRCCNFENDLFLFYFFGNELNGFFRKIPNQNLFVFIPHGFAKRVGLTMTGNHIFSRCHSLTPNITVLKQGRISMLFSSYKILNQICMHNRAIFRNGYTLSFFLVSDNSYSSLLFRQGACVAMHTPNQF